MLRIARAVRPSTLWLSVALLVLGIGASQYRMAVPTPEQSWGLGGGRVTPFMAHLGADAPMAFSPDGSLLLVSEHNGSLCINTRTARPLDELEDRCLQGLQFNRDGHRVVVASSCDVAVWDMQTRTVIRKWTNVFHERSVPGETDPSVSMHPDGNLVATTDFDGAGLLWDVRQDKPLRALPTQAGPCRAVRFSRDGTRLAIGTDNKFFIWDWKEQRILASRSIPRPASQIEFGPSDRWVTLGCDWCDENTLDFRGQLVVMDPPNLATIATRESQGYHFDQTDAGALLIQPSNSPVAAFWDPMSGASKPTGLRAGYWLAASPDGHQVATGDATTHHMNRDGTLYDTTRGAITLDMGSSSFLLHGLDGDRILVQADVYHGIDGKAEFRNCAIGTSRGLEDLALHGAFSDDGHYLIRQKGSQVELWDLRRKHLKAAKTLPRGRIFEGYCLGAWSPDRSSVAFRPEFDDFGNEDIFIWNLETGRMQRVSTAFPSIQSLAIDNSGHTLAISHVRGNHRDATGTWLFNSRTGKEIRLLTPLWGDLLFSPDGRYLLLVEDNEKRHVSKIHIWSMPAGQKIGVIESGNESYGLRFSRDGRWLLTFEWDRRLERSVGLSIWDFSQRRRRATIPTGPINSIHISQDGRTIVTSGDRIALWNFDDGALLATILLYDEGRAWFALTPDGLNDGSPGVANRVDVQLNGQVYPMSVFDKRLHRPGLISSLLTGHRPHAPAEIVAAPAPPASRGRSVGFQSKP